VFGRKKVDTKSAWSESASAVLRLFRSRKYTWMCQQKMSAAAGAVAEEVDEAEEAAAAGASKKSTGRRRMRRRRRRLCMPFTPQDHYGGFCGSFCCEQTMETIFISVPTSHNCPSGEP
jgi:hypothetical protein